jgi:hypothetical protein
MYSIPCGKDKTYVGAFIITKCICDVHREWERSGGCYWICAEEIFRHYLIHLFSNILANSTADPATTVQALATVSKDSFEVVARAATHGLLSSRLHQMSAELNSFFESLDGLALRDIEVLLAFI